LLDNISFNGDNMKYITYAIKRICLGVISIYSFNVLFKLLNVVIPINVYTIGLSSIFGITGLITVILLKFII